GLGVGSFCEAIIVRHRTTPLPNPPPTQVGPARLAHDKTRPGQARGARGREQTEFAARGVHYHHLLSPESASDARRRLASIAAAPPCTLWIQASAGARALGASSASSATAPARSPRAALASLRATTAAASLPGASSTRRRRTSFSAFSCSRPSTPSGGGAT